MRKFYLFPCLIFAFYALVPLIRGAYGIFGGALILLSLFLIVRNRSLVLLPKDWIFAACLAIFPLSLLPSLIVNHGNSSYLDYPVRALLFIPLIYGLRYNFYCYDALKTFFLIGIGTGGYASAIFSVKSILVDNVSRVGLPITNPIPYGQIAAMIALLSLVCFLNRSGALQRLFYGGAVICAFFSVFASGSKGAALGLIAGIISFAFLRGRMLIRDRREFIMLALLFCGFAALTPVLFASISEIYFQSILALDDPVTAMNADFGTRVLLALISVKTFVAHPLLGIGPGNAHLAIHSYCQSYQCTPNFSAWRGMHSQYFDLLASAGLVGILGWFFFCIGIAWLFLKQKMRPSTGDVGYDYDFSSAGFSCIIMMMVSAIPQPLYHHNISVIFFFFTITFLWFFSFPNYSSRDGIVRQPGFGTG